MTKQEIFEKCKDLISRAHARKVKEYVLDWAIQSRLDPADVVELEEMAFLWEEA